MAETAAIRRLLAVIIFCLMCAAAVPWRLIAFVWRAGPGLGPMLTRSIDRRLPGYSDFIGEVRRQTRPGERIVVAVPGDNWNDYSFAYYRASYLLSGRDVLPLMGPDSRPVPKNWRDGQVLAIYGLPVPPTETKIVWRGKGGAIIRR